MDLDRLRSLFDLEGRTAIVTGGSGLLGSRHRLALQTVGANVISFDIVKSPDPLSMVVDITVADEVRAAVSDVVDRFGCVDILINNAANNPKVETSGGVPWNRFESFHIDTWTADIAVGLTGAFLVSQAVGALMAEAGRGVILNICSDLSLIAPDQRIYRDDGVANNLQQTKPVSYSVVKHGLLGLTRFLSTYWADRGVRVNALSPGGVANGQDLAFVARLTSLIPMGRMANIDEYEGAVLFHGSDASSYMTGQNLVIDGGRTVW